MLTHGTAASTASHGRRQRGRHVRFVPIGDINQIPRLDPERKKKDRLAAVVPKQFRSFAQAATAEAFFRFLRLARKPTKPKPAPNIGSAAGNGVAPTSELLSPILTSSKIGEA